MSYDPENPATKFYCGLEEVSIPVGHIVSMDRFFNRFSRNYFDHPKLPQPIFLKDYDRKKRN